MKRGDLVTFLTDFTGMGPMIYQHVEDGMIIGGQPLSIHGMGICLSQYKKKFNGMQYVCVLVNEQVGYVREEMVKRVAGTSRCLCR